MKPGHFERRCLVSYKIDTLLLEVDIFAAVVVVVIAVGLL